MFSSRSASYKIIIYHVISLTSCYWFIDGFHGVKSTSKRNRVTQTKFLNKNCPQIDLKTFIKGFIYRYIWRCAKHMIINCNLLGNHLITNYCVFSNVPDFQKKFIRSTHYFDLAQTFFEI